MCLPRLGRHHGMFNVIIEFIHILKNDCLRYALVSTWLGWLLCFSIVFLIPIDILNVCTLFYCTPPLTIAKMDYDECTARAEEAQKPPPSYNGIEPYVPSEVITCTEPVTSLPNSYMTAQWKVLWWGTMILSW